MQVWPHWTYVVQVFLLDLDGFDMKLIKKGFLDRRYCDPIIL
jgi:hypothetical protein